MTPRDMHGNAITAGREIINTKKQNPPRQHVFGITPSGGVHIGQGAWRQTTVSRFNLEEYWLVVV